MNSQKFHSGITQCGNFHFFRLCVMANTDAQHFSRCVYQAKSAFDSDHTVTPLASTTAPAASSTTKPFPGGRVNRITTIHPKSYEDAQLVGRALRDGVPVVLNLTGVAEAVAYRIVDFSAGVVFGVRGSLERVTPRVFLLSPAQVNIKVEEPTKPASAHDLFAD